MILSSLNLAGRNYGACGIKPPPPGMLAKSDGLSTHIGRPVAVNWRVGSSWLMSVSVCEAAIELLSPVDLAVYVLMLCLFASAFPQGGLHGEGIL
jgi:hypothetical protein